MLPSSGDYFDVFSDDLHDVELDACVDGAADDPPQNSAGSTSSSTTLADVTVSPGKRKRELSPCDRPTRKRISCEFMEDKEKPVIIPERLPGSWSGNLSRCAWGVIWEIARLGVNKTIDFTKPIEVETFRKLEGTNQTVGPIVRHIILKLPEPKNLFSVLFSTEMDAKSPWRHLDEEEKSLEKNGTGGVGCESDNPALQLSNEPYGGLVEFVARLQLVGNEFKVTLLPPQKCPSTRFSRRFGSKRFFRLRIPKSILSNTRQSGNLMEFVQRPFVIMKQVFRAFTAKDMNVFFVQTYEEERDGYVFPRYGKRKIADPMPFLDFVDWFNPLESNSHQTMAKWASRFALGLSNSVPGIKLKPHNIFFERDINSSAFVGDGKVPSEQIMTDGCGFTNKAMLRLLTRRISWDHTPTAIQCRIAGAKGLLLLHPDIEQNETPEPKVWIRDSQKKIHHATEPNDDPAMLTIDVLRASHMRSPARLSPETIINLSENGVPREVFLELFKAALHEALDELMSWENPENAAPGGVGSSIESRITLWSNVARAGAVTSARMARLNSSSARVKGYVYETRYADDNDDDEEEEEEESPDNESEPSIAWWPDAVSGQPSSLEETVLCLLDSGFDPRLHWIIREKLRWVVNRVGDTFRKRCKISVPESCSAFVVPDPCGVLEEGEIHVRCSHNMQFSDGWERSIVLGDVLVTRHPCKLPSDIQKVKAVDRPELRDYTDVVVFSTKGNRSLASLLAGGDYDGDKVEVFWNRPIVDAFRPPSQEYADEPPGLDKAFRQHNESVDSFRTRMPSTVSKYQRVHEIQNYLLVHICNNAKYIGLYNDFYIKAMYTKGYFHEDTKRLAYMFTTILDGGKTGKTVTAEAYREDQRTYGNVRKPEWNESEADASRADESNLLYPKRPDRLPTFIMDYLLRAGRKLVADKLEAITEDLRRNSSQPDEALIAPYKNVLLRIESNLKDSDPFLQAVGERLKQEVKSLESHVDKQQREWNKRVVTLPDVSFSNLPIEERQDRLRRLSQGFALDPPDITFIILEKNDRDRIKASYAYKKWPRTRFPWDMCMRVLCEVKGESTPGSFKAVIHDFYYRSKLCEPTRRQR